MRPWIESRLIIPFIPFVIDLIVRILLLRADVAWWDLPDLKTFSITLGFFCFLISADIKEVGRLPADNEYYSLINTMRRRFMMYGSIATAVFGISTGIDAAEEHLKIADLSTLLYPSLILVTLVSLVGASAEAIIANLRYKFGYAG